MNFTDGTSTSQHGGIDETENKYSKVYIGGLVEDIGNDKLQNEFEKFGQLVKVWVARSPHSKGYAFVEYTDPKHAARAIQEMNGKEIFGSKILVQISRPGTKKKRPLIPGQPSPVIAQYTNVKLDYELEDRKRIQSPDSSEFTRSKSFETENDKPPKRFRESFDLNSPRMHRRSPERNSSRRPTRSRERDCVSNRRHNRSGERDILSNRRNGSRDRDPSRRHRSSNDRTSRLSRDKDANSKDKNASIDARKQTSDLSLSTKDDETIARIREAVVRETVPQIYSMILRDILLHDPMKMQSIFPFPQLAIQNPQHYLPQIPFQSHLQTDRNFLSNVSTITNNMIPPTNLQEYPVLIPQASTAILQNEKSPLSSLPSTTCSTVYSDRTPNRLIQNSLQTTHSPFVPDYMPSHFPSNTSPATSQYIPAMLQNTAPPLVQGRMSFVDNSQQNTGQIGTLPVVRYPIIQNAKPTHFPGSVESPNISSASRLQNHHNNRR